MANTAITVARGDGIGPEIMDATLHILKEAGARIEKYTGFGLKLVILDLMSRVTTGGLDFVKIETLCTFNGQPGFSLSQGQ